MPGEHNFEYLPLVRTFKGPAKLRGGGKAAPQTIANRNARQAHSLALDTAAQAFSANWQARKAERQAVGEALPEIPSGVPILLQVDPGLDLDALRESRPSPARPRLSSQDLPRGRGAVTAWLSGN